MTPKVIRLILITLALGAAGSCTTASNTGDDKTTDTEIRAWLDKWSKAFQSHDTKTVMTMYAPDVLAYDMVPPLQYNGKDAYGKDYEEFVSQYDGPIAIEFRDIRVTPAGNYAISTCLEHVSGTLKNGGQKSAIWVRVTSVYKKTDGNWLDIHDHVSVPTDMATGKAMLDLQP